MANGNNNPFGSLSGLMTTSSLDIQEEARNRILQERRRETIGPVNALATQFGEFLGTLIRKKGFGNLTAQERQAVQNTDTLTKGLDAAMRRIEEEGIELGTSEARMVVLEEQFAQAMRDGNLKAADAISKSLMEMQEQQLIMAQLKAGNDFTKQRTNRLVEQTTLDYLRLKAERDSQESARLEAANKGADSLRQEIDSQIKEPAKVVQAVDRVERLLAEGTPAGDTGAIFAVLETWQPGSKITDADFEKPASEAKQRVIDAENVPENIKDTLRNIFVSGDSFTPQQRIELINAVRAGARPAVTQALTIIEDASSLARSRNYNLDAVLSGRANIIRDVGDRVAPIPGRDVTAVANKNKTLREILGFRDLDAEIRGL